MKITQEQLFGYAGIVHSFADGLVQALLPFETIDSQSNDVAEAVADGLYQNIRRMLQEIGNQADLLVDLSRMKLDTEDWSHIFMNIASITLLKEPWIHSHDIHGNIVPYGDPRANWTNEEYDEMVRSLDAQLRDSRL